VQIIQKFTSSIIFLRALKEKKYLCFIYLKKKTFLSMAGPFENLIAYLSRKWPNLTPKPRKCCGVFTSIPTVISLIRGLFNDAVAQSFSPSS